MSSLYSMLGPGITERTKFQWIKMIGKENLLPPTGRNNPLVVEKDHIVRSFHESKEKGRTTPELANIMLLSYLSWIQLPEQQRITGMIAERIHDRVMKAIATHHKRSWAPEKHKCPYYGIINLFNMIKSGAQCDLLPPLPGKPDRCPKQKADAELVSSWVSPEFQDATNRDARHPITEWDFFNQLDALEELIEKEESIEV